MQLKILRCSLYLSSNCYVIGFVSHKAYGGRFWQCEQLEVCLIAAGLAFFSIFQSVP